MILNHYIFQIFNERLNSKYTYIKLNTVFNVHYTKYYILSPIIVVIIPIILSKCFPSLNFLSTFFV